MALIEKEVVVLIGEDNESSRTWDWIIMIF
jgi:hypothetical protein